MLETEYKRFFLNSHENISKKSVSTHISFKYFFSICVNMGWVSTYSRFSCQLQISKLRRKVFICLKQEVPTMKTRRDNAYFFTSFEKFIQSTDRKIFFLPCPLEFRIDREIWGQIMKKLIIGFLKLIRLYLWYLLTYFYS